MKNAFLLFFTLLVSNLTIAQDIIIKTSGDEVTVKVTEITLQDVVYKKPDSLQGRTFTIPKREVFMIKYENGSKEVITQETANEDLAALTPEMAYQRGRQDARRFYKDSSVFWGSAAAGVGSLATAGISLAIPLVVAATPPKVSPRRLPDPRLIDNKEYMRGYRKQAHNKKIGKAAAGAGTGIVTGAGVTLVVLLILFSR